MIWQYNSSESTYFAVFPQSKVQIVVEGDEFAEADELGTFLPLKEGCFYHYRLISETKASLSKASSFLNKNASSRSRGSIAPGTAVGYGRLYLEGAEEADLSLRVEVASEVISYKKDYQDLLRQLTEDIADLQMQCTSNVSGFVAPDASTPAQNDIQRLFFLLGLIANSDFDTALREIVRRPHVQLIEVEEEVDVRNLARFGRNEMRQMASASRRIELPDHLKGSVAGLTTIPERIATTRQYESVDTQENRFIKYVLTSFQDQLSAYQQILKTKKKNDALMTVEIDLNTAKQMLSKWVGHEFFKNVGRLSQIPMSSVVLQRREGYREVFKKWLQSHAGAQIAWKNGEDVYEANQRQMATLYEYWCFFRLLKVVGGIFNIGTAEIAKKMIGTSADGLSLKLKAGETITLEGAFDSGKIGARYRQLAVEYSYNRTFSAKGKEMSWTLPMRPDYTLSFRPKGMPIEEAIENELVTYVHFDAKYKSADLVSSLKQIGSAADDEASQEEEVRARDVKRVDILKMHAYRDAIRRTGGAYVLFPGQNVEDAKIDREHMEIIPGLGAFVLSPSNDSSDKIKGFLKDVAQHLCDRITRWEKYTYEKHEIYNQNDGDFKAMRELTNTLLIQEYDNVETREGKRINLEQLKSERYLDPDKYISVNPETPTKLLKYAYEKNIFVLEKTEWEKLNKPDPAIISLISVAWRPPVNLLVQRYIDTMQGWMFQAQFKDYPIDLSMGKSHDADYLVWEVLAIDTDAFKTYLVNREKKQKQAEAKYQA